MVNATWWEGNHMGFFLVHWFVAGSYSYTMPTGFQPGASPAKTYILPPAAAPEISSAGWGNGGPEAPIQDHGRPITRAADALTRTGYELRFELSGGAADANVFNERGLQCVNLANGMTDIHTADEHISVADLEGMVDVTLALIDAAVA